jgi:hypothetical protein
VRKHAFEGRVEWTLRNVVANKKHERTGQGQPIISGQASSH